MSAPRISDHAVLRALERICGIPVEQVREAIAADMARATAAADGIGGGVYLVVREHHAFVVRHGTVTTVLANPDLYRRWEALFDAATAAGR